MDNLIDCLNDISKVNTIYTIILLASAENIRLIAINEGYIKQSCNQGLGTLLLNYILATMNYSSSSLTATDIYGLDSSYDGGGEESGVGVSSTTTLSTTTSGHHVDLKPCLLIRMADRLALLLNYLIVFIQNQFNEHTATLIASFSVLIILLSIMCCFAISLMREEERKIKEQYNRLSAGSSQSFIAIKGRSGSGSSSTTSRQTTIDGTSETLSIKQRFVGGTGGGNGENRSRILGSLKLASLTSYLTTPIVGVGFGGTSSTHYTTIGSDPFKPASSSSPTNAHSHPHPLPTQRNHNKLHVVELRRETYFGLLRLLKPGCRTIVLFCDAQSRFKLLTKFYQCIYPYRKNKTLQFAFLLIEKNIGWYKDLLRLALNEKRDLHINPTNCIGTVLVLSGFKKYFSVYHASDSRCDPDEPFILEESLLDNFPDWLERLFAGKVSRYYVKYWPDGMR